MSAAPQVPAYLARILDRAAMQIHSQWPTQQVEFPWWSEGTDTLYRARLVWLHDDPAPRVQVHDARSGDFVCRSMVADLFVIDPTCWDHTPADDDLDRHRELLAASRRGRPAEPDASRGTR